MTARQTLKIAAGVVFWAIVVFGTLPGYRHTEIFYVNLYDPPALWERLRDLGWVVFSALPAALLLGFRKPGFQLRRPSRKTITRTAFLLTVFVTGLLVFYAHVLWEAVPRIPDSVAYLFQAKIFAAGRLWAPVPEPFNPFDYMFTWVSDNRFISRYSPGFPLLLAAGLRVNLPWIIPPLFGGACAWLMYRLYDRLFKNSLHALFALILTLGSPYFLGVSGQLLSHTPSLFCYLVFLHAGISACRRDRAASGIAAGAALGYFFLTRQLTAVVLGAPFAIFLGTIMIQKGHRRALSGFILAGTALLAIQLAYNREFTGNPLRFPFHEGAFGRLDRLGFYHRVKWDVWPVPGQNDPVHTPLKALKNIHLCFSRINRSLFGWPSGLFFLPLALLWRSSRPAWDRVFALSIAVMAVAYSVYWFPGAGLLGARYYFEALPAFVFLTVRGCSGLHRYLSGRWEGRLRWFPAMFVAASIVHGALFFWPRHIELSWDAFAKPFGRAFDRLEERCDTPALVFIAGDTTSYSFGFFKNDIFLKAPVIFARDLGPEKNRSTLSRFSERRPYLFHFDATIQHLLPLDSECTIPEGEMAAIRAETAVTDEFRTIDPDRWMLQGRSKDCIRSHNGTVRVEGIMPTDMAPGSHAYLRYLDIPLVDLEVSASFRAATCRDLTISLSLDNGRYLDEFQRLESAIVTYFGPSDRFEPFYLFHWKGLGFKWSNQGFPAFRDERNAFHRLRLTIDAGAPAVSARVDDRLIGTQFIPFRSSMLKIRLGVGHDGSVERPVDVEWDSFRLIYFNRKTTGTTEPLREAGG